MRYCYRFVTLYACQKSLCDRKVTAVKRVHLGTLDVCTRRFVPVSSAETVTSRSITTGSGESRETKAEVCAHHCARPVAQTAGNRDGLGGCCSAGGGRSIRPAGAGIRRAVRRLGGRGPAAHRWWRRQSERHR